MATLISTDQARRLHTQLSLRQKLAAKEEADLKRSQQQHRDSRPVKTSFQLLAYAGFVALLAWAWFPMLFIMLGIFPGLPVTLGLGLGLLDMGSRAKTRRLERRVERLRDQSVIVDVADAALEQWYQALIEALTQLPDATLQAPGGDLTDWRDTLVAGIRRRHHLPERIQPLQQLPLLRNLSVIDELEQSRRKALAGIDVTDEAEVAADEAMVEIATKRAGLLAEATTAAVDALLVEQNGHQASEASTREDAAEHNKAVVLGTLSGL
jgi:hypothetical protein